MVRSVVANDKLRVLAVVPLPPRMLVAPAVVPSASLWVRERVPLVRLVVPL
jgi:hypothetical protein